LSGLLATHCCCWLIRLNDVIEKPIPLARIVVVTGTRLFRLRSWRLFCAGLYDALRCVLVDFIRQWGFFDGTASLRFITHGRSFLASAAMRGGKPATQDKIDP
jgi:hypothetical protein